VIAVGAREPLACSSGLSRASYRLGASRPSRCGAKLVEPAAEAREEAEEVAAARGEAEEVAAARAEVAANRLPGVVSA
jgi:hypothetical protein